MQAAQPDSEESGREKSNFPLDTINQEICWPPGIRAALTGMHQWASLIIKTKPFIQAFCLRTYLIYACCRDLWRENCQEFDFQFVIENKTNSYVVNVSCMLTLPFLLLCILNCKVKLGNRRMEIGFWIFIKEEYIKTSHTFSKILHSCNQIWELSLGFVNCYRDLIN